MVKGTTSSGFSFEYDEQAQDDMRFVDLLTVAIDPEAGLLEQLRSASTMLTLLIGPELKRQLYDHIGKSYGGRVPKDALEQELKEIMAAAGKDAEKNS